jgi:hypothetical protein
MAGVSKVGGEQVYAPAGRDDQSFGLNNIKDEFTNNIINMAKNGNPSEMYDLINFAKQNNLIDTFDDVSVFNSNKELIHFISSNLIVYKPNNPNFILKAGFCYCTCGGQSCGWVEGDNGYTCQGTCNSCTTTGCSSLAWNAN